MSHAAAVARIVVAGAALVASFETIWRGDRGAWDTLQVQTSLMIAITFVWSGWALIADRERPPAPVEGGAVLYATVQAVLFTFVLDPELASTAEYFGVTNVELHTLYVPVAAFAVWVFFAPHRTLHFVFAVLWPVYLVLYLFAFILRGAYIDGAGYPYAFLDLDVHGWRGLVENGVLYLGVLIIAGAILIMVDRALPARTPLAGSEH